MQKPALGFWQIWNLSFGFFGIQIGFALQNANVSRIFQTLGASIDELPILWIAGPVTGLLVQPLIGHFSDRTWTKFGRRRPYFFVGAVLATLALFVMPNSPFLWVAAATLWILDASINVSMEPFRAFVGDMLPSRQRTQGFAMQAVFIGAGALLASMAPFLLTNVLGVANEAAPGVVPDAVKYSFFMGAIALFAAVMWTIVSTKEYSPEELQTFAEADAAAGAVEEHREPVSSSFFTNYGFIFLVLGVVTTAMVAAMNADKQLYILGVGLALLGLGFLLNAMLKKSGKDDNFFSHILSDLTTMPSVMRRLAVVQFFSWFGLFLMWIYTTPAVTSWHYNAPEPTSPGYGDGADWVGVLFAVYNGVAAVYSFLLPRLAEQFGKRVIYATGLIAGGVGLALFYVITDPAMLIVGMIGVGIAWATILTLPYAILSDALPPQKMGVFMGIFNFFIVLPQLVVAGIMGPIVRGFFGGEAIWGLVLAGVSMGIAAMATALVQRQAPIGAGAAE